MAPLADDLRRALERQIIAAREVAETAARTSLVALGVERSELFTGMTAEQRRLRVALRARARQLGDNNPHAGVPALVEEIAYAQWHRMIFARFLAENGLLMHPSGAPVTLAECAELAEEEGEPDAWMVAARYASGMLPGIFAIDDPVAQVRFAPEGRATLETILDALPAPVFTSDDALGWVYQFWQTKKKAEVNDSGRKIGGRDISPVTQLFTEHYMVQFLLENSLGAWWAARSPGSPLIREWPYLRFHEDGAPASGTFPCWPNHAAEVTVMDPCCGSGHFLVAAFEMLRRMRMEQEGLGEAEAAEVVIRDNLYGLEIDPRCTQIAAFALAFAGWKAGGYRPLPIPNIACSGIPVKGQLDSWTRLAGDDQNMQAAMERLYQLFKDAPTLGSLINPADVPERDRMFTPDYACIEPLLVRALKRERNADDPTAAVFGAAAEGVVKAARSLAGSYTLVATNVPYLGRGNQSEVLREFCETRYSDAKADLATAFLQRCRAFTKKGGSTCAVTPQNWLFLGSYKTLREKLLNSVTWNIVARIGENGFQSAQAAGAFTALFILTNVSPTPEHISAAFDASIPRNPTEKADILRCGSPSLVSQSAQFNNPDARFSLTAYRETLQLLSRYADSYLGLGTGDFARYGRCFWEFAKITSEWAFQQGTVTEHLPFGGREHAVFWDADVGRVRGMSLQEREKIHNQDQSGRQAWGKRGVCVSLMRGLNTTLYTGEVYDKALAVLVPKDPSHLASIWAFCSSPDFHRLVRRIDHNIIVANGTLVKVPFDLDYWQKIANEAGPLPEPHSNDPTQWLFEGHPKGSTDPLQVAVARLLGYHWPQQKDDGLDAFADEDGIVCLPPVAGEQPAAERLRTLLVTAYGKDWSQSELERLLTAAGFGGKGLDLWLRDGFWPQHCRLFHNRPFIWHIWDGRKDGFAALVNYQKLDAALLEKLIYTHLGRWIQDRKAEVQAGVAGADDRLVAALNLQKKLVAIREGEPPYDIYVRWKKLHEQPIGWNPDVNDGVRVNIRPFVEADVLRSKFTIDWNKDRGTNPDGTERRNDLNYSVAEKQAARERAGQ